MLRNTLIASLFMILPAACSTLGIGEDSKSVSTPCETAPSMTACTADSQCSGNEECDDGQCEWHDSYCDDDAGAGTGTGVAGEACALDRDCGPGLECEHGACAVDDDDNDDNDPQGTECVADADCGAGLECDDGFCEPHDGD